MNKKGFTLIELLAVIVILAIILVIAVPKILDVIDNTRLNSFNLSSKLLENAAEKYIFNENISVPINTTVKINYTDIKTANYVSTLVDPISKSECIYSKVNVTNNNGKYEFDSDIVCENYIDLEDFNKVKNYDFSNGTTDWTGVDSTISVSSNILTNTGNGGNNLPVTSQYTSMDSVTGHKVYMFARARLTNSDYTQMTMILSSSSWNWEEVAYNYNSRTNTWYNISAIATIGAGYSGYVRIMLSHGYNTAETANGKIMQLDGNVGIYMIDLTDIYGSGNEPTKAQMDTIIENMT